MTDLFKLNRPLLACLAILAGCATAQDPATSASSTHSTPTPPVAATSTATNESLTLRDIEAQIRELTRRDPVLALMTAEIANQRGDFVSASIAYTEAARLQKDPELAKRALEISLGSGDTDRGLQAAQLWAQLDPADEQASRSVLLLQLASNRIEEAYPAFEAYYNSLKAQESVHPGVAEASPLRIVLELLVRIPDKNKSYATGLRLLGNDPKALEEQYILSQLAEHCGLHAQAIAHIQHVINAVPEERYHILQAQYMEKRDGNTDQAVAKLTALTQQNPQWFSTRLYLARLATQANRWAEAKDWFAQLIALQPQNVPLYSSQGFVLSKLKDRLAAGEHFNTYLTRTKPEDRQNEILILLTMAELNQDEKHYKEAIKWLQRAPQAPENLDIQLKLSNIYKSEGKPALAEKTLREFKPQNEDDSVRWTLAMSQLQEKQKKPSEAARVIDNTLKQYPDQPDLLYERAMVAERQKDLINVEKFLRRLIVVKPDNPHGYNALGYTWAENNMRLPEALDLIKKAHELAPKDPYILDSLGWVYFRLGDYAQAETHLKAAFALNPEEEIGLHLVELYLKQKRHSDAQTLLQDLQTRFPDSARVPEWVKKSAVSAL